MFRLPRVNRIFSIDKGLKCVTSNAKYCTAAEIRHATTKADGHDGDIGKQAQFSSAKIGPFFQSPPQLQNQYTGDAVLQSYLHRYIPNQVT